MEVKDSETLLKLKCQNCKDYLYPPISICRAGHSICNICRVEVKKCFDNVCNKNILKDVRNFQLESIISIFKVPCKNQTFGCGTLETTSKIRGHQELCIYGEIPCPSNENKQCRWRGALQDLVVHATNSHTVFVGNTGSSPLSGLFKIKKEKIIYSLVCAFDNVFRYYLKYDEKMIKFNVQFVRSQRNINYFYKVTLIDKVNPKAAEQCRKESPCDSINATIISISDLKQICSSDSSLFLQFEIIAKEDPDNLEGVQVQVKSEDKNEPDTKRKRTNSTESISFPSPSTSKMQ